MTKTRLLPIRGCGDPQRVGDVVFVHGLNGNPRHYWCHAGEPTNFWPAWLGEDLPQVGVWSLGYENAAFKSRKITLLGRTGFRGFAMPLTDRVENVLLQLKLEGIGTRPLVFIAHSMGGLLVKQLLRTANDSSEPEWRAVLKQTRGVCFIATPHIGSDLAKWGTYFRTLLGTNVSMDELRPHEPLLRNLKQWYSNFVSREGGGIKTLSFYETKPLPHLGNLVVEPGDADPGVPLAGNYPLDEDHGSICTPESKASLLYKAVLCFVRDDCFQTTGTPPFPIGVTPVAASSSDQTGSRVLPWPADNGRAVESPRRSPAGLALGMAALAVACLLAGTFWALTNREPSTLVSPLAGITLARIAPGSFEMGSPDGEGRDDEHPRHLSRVKTFYLGRNEVTQEEYTKVMGHNPSRFKSDPANPVDNVSWLDAVKFCNQLSVKEGLDCYYSINEIRGEMPSDMSGFKISYLSDKTTVKVPNWDGNGYRLPTEAEWEYACRAGNAGRYYFGDSKGKLDDYAWFSENSGDSSHAVRLKLPNAWGLYDMHGNVREWCWDEMDHLLADPSSRSLHRSLRGGSWIDVADVVRSAARRWEVIDYLSEAQGFRVARNVR